MESPFPLHDATVGTSSCHEPLVWCYHTLAAAEITWLCRSPCRSRAHWEPLVQKTYVLWRVVLPPAPEPFGSDRLSPARQRVSEEAGSPAASWPGAEALARLGMARRSRPAWHCQERVSGCLSAALKRALPGALGCAKRTSKDVQPDARSRILVGWVWGKALTSLAPSSSGWCWPPA